MPQFEKREGSGALFKNDKEGVENRPDYRGDILIDGQEYWLSSWLKKDKNGNTFMSLQAQKKDAKPATKAPPIPGIPGDIPF